MNSELKPKIRFKGFTDDWEQRKLGDIGKAQSGIGFPDKEQGGKIGVPFYKVSDMNNLGNEYEMQTSNNYVSLEQINKNHWNVIDNVPAIMFAKVGAAVMLNRKRLCRFPFLLDNNSMAFIFDKKILNPDFSKFIFERIYLPSLVQVGALPSYNAPQVESINIKLPNYNEQRKISYMFSNIDNLITLHQRKCDKLIELKKSLLEKMFPQNNSVIPEIRFKGFTDDWEQRKFTEFVEFFKGQTYSPNDVRENGTLVLRSSNVQNGEVTRDDNVYISNKVVNVSNVKIGDVIVVVRNGSRALIGKHAKIKEKMPNTVIGAFMTGIRSKNSEFINSLLNTSIFEQKIEKNMGATINQITGYMFANMNFKIPNDDEQKTIGRLFDNLDNLITLHQRKHDKLNKIKQSLLNDMFV